LIGPDPALWVGARESCATFIKAKHEGCQGEAIKAKGPWVGSAHERVWDLGNSEDFSMFTKACVSWNVILPLDGMGDILTSGFADSVCCC